MPRIPAPTDEPPYLTTLVIYFRPLGDVNDTEKCGHRARKAYKEALLDRHRAALDDPPIGCDEESDFPRRRVPIEKSLGEAVDLRHRCRVFYDGAIPDDLEVPVGLDRPASGRHR